MAAGDPQTFKEVFDFYSRYVKILYCDVQATNVLPVEVLFELNAAFDHASRFWIYGETEAAVSKKVYSHLKRSCLDIFKLRAKETLDHYAELRKIDLSFLDNGTFETKMRKLIHVIRKETREARSHEGKTSNDADGWVEAFEKWQPVYEKCSQFDEEFYHNPHLDWARKKNFRMSTKKFLLSIIVAAIVGAFIKDPLSEFLKWGSHKIVERVSSTASASPTPTPSPSLSPP
jgi:hypothetical protein